MKDILDDATLSWKAKGLYKVLSMNLKDGDHSLEKLKTMSSDGKSSTASAMKELIKSGYVVYDRLKFKGRFIGSHITLPFNN